MTDCHKVTSCHFFGESRIRRGDMATKTFLKLPQEKRERILEAAWAEFETVSFAEASINRIIRRAGISRGSFYQYFTDKEDLFIYLMFFIIFFPFSFKSPNIFI